MYIYFLMLPFSCMQIHQVFEYLNIPVYICEVIQVFCTAGQGKIDRRKVKTAGLRVCLGVQMKRCCYQCIFLCMCCFPYPPHSRMVKQRRELGDLFVSLQCLPTTDRAGGSLLKIARAQWRRRKRRGCTSKGLLSGKLSLINVSNF